MPQLCFLLFLLLCACSDIETYAPVLDVTEAQPTAKKPILQRKMRAIHQVQHGESLYAIAWKYGYDYRELAKANDLHSPYVLYSGQKILLASGKPLARIQVEKTIPLANLSSLHFIWPIKGRILHAFSAENKGLDIQQSLGTPIVAAEKGSIVYAGNGLRGYGNLIIIKHNNDYLSAYAHNRVLLVKEGDLVEKGQKIAEIGNSGSHKVILHFEIRKSGKPIDPLLVLGS